MQIILSETTNVPMYHKCNKCSSTKLGSNGQGDWVCYECGRVNGMDISSIIDMDSRKKTYKRIFYFNERCSRWLCNEPKIDPGIWQLIKLHSEQGPFKNRRFKRRDIGKLLRSIKVPIEIQQKYRSRKFKKNLLTPKRFYDKYFEKWKLIASALNNEIPHLPDQNLVRLLKRMFVACQEPFEIYRHVNGCTRINDCDKYFNCWHNFINYDFVFRKLLQIADYHFNHKGCYNLFKNEFPLVSKKLRDTKLRPLWFKICEYNDWPSIGNE